ncbi:OmpA family protein [Jiulongibacter sp. NS-SX5]|uniref:OmpA family protein n=1 Tax=Jiulongibacter sp. NS-SX5 TaxID=3463854 RepID=UPI004059CEB8
MKLKSFLLCISISLYYLPTFAQDVNGSQDHEIIGRYPGSTIKYYYTKEYAELDFPQEIKDAEPSKIVTGKGKHTSILYEAPTNVSPLEIFRNYESAIKNGKGTLLFSCKGKYAPDGCDDYKKFYGLKFFNANYYEKRHNNTDQYILLNGSDDQAFLLGIFENATTKIYVEVGIDGNSFGDKPGIQVEILEEAKMKDGLITSALFEEEMDMNGKIALYGILFETGKATLKDESKHELSLVVEYLQKYPNINIYVAGHTDDTGSLDLNMELSQQRAEAVITYLTDQGVNQNRMHANGVGPFAPVTTNETEEGKKLNRRVEIVKRLR